MQTTQQNIETLTRKAVDHELLAELAVEEETRKKNTALAGLYRELVATAKALAEQAPSCAR
jgi:ABC-type taurine transport system ATPase subunit